MPAPPSWSMVDLFPQSTRNASRDASWKSTSLNGRSRHVFRLSGSPHPMCRLLPPPLATSPRPWEGGFQQRRNGYHQVRRRLAPPGPFQRLTKRAKYTITEWPPNGIADALSRVALRRELASCGVQAPLRLYDHHRCHAAAAAVASGATQCTVLTVDGVGDGASASVNVFDQGRLTRIATTPARHSLGVFFEHVTNLLNMRELEDEGKVMALADYASPIADEQNPLLDLVSVRGMQFVTAARGPGMYSKLRWLQWSYPNEQFAYMAQRVVERRLVDFARQAIGHTRHRLIAFAGGVASNVKATRHVRLLDEVDDVYVFPHMGDGGLAAGAAVCAAMDLGEPIDLQFEDLGFGPAFEDRALREALHTAALPFCECHNVAQEVAALIADDKVVLWFQGGMEYGPRALGHRSVLARPDRPAIRDRINLLLKRRVWYQPFCPSILESDAQAAFSDWKGRPDRHMTMAYLVAPSYREKLAAVISVDGTCRPQIVKEDAQTDFGDLLKEVRARLGLGAVLNTSFNIHGQPLVHTPQEAIAVFRESGADALTLGRFVVRRA